MKTGVLLSLLLALGCVHVHGAPVEQTGIEDGSCEDAVAKGAAEQALKKINHERKEGYVFALHRLSNAHMMKHGETGVVYYLTLDVVETNCSVLSRSDLKSCEPRSEMEIPVYGQCKAAIYMNRPQRVVRLYKYKCVVRPVPGERVNAMCPDCPSLVATDNEKIKEMTAELLEKFNKDSKLANRFDLLEVSRATVGWGGIGMIHRVEFTIQETTCANTTEAGTACPLMECEFSHKGFCKGSRFKSPMATTDSVMCEIYEPEAAEREKTLHQQGDSIDHSHNDTQAAAADQTQTHDHVHDHTKSHSEHDATQKHAKDSDHHHTHDHDAGTTHRHAHAHSHDHGHNHDHVHAHHAKAHDHTGDATHHHHDYKHPDGTQTHEHDHEIALDHDHKHAHLHDHEHHHHHHDHEHETTAHDHPEGTVEKLAAMNATMTLPSFPDVPAAGPEVAVTLPAKPDPQIPGQLEPTIQAFPTKLSGQCKALTAPGPDEQLPLVDQLFFEDAKFKIAA